jgi:UDP-N-acetylmuramoyl-tripeptide--D-alanyl-D-alanine ligase
MVQASEYRTPQLLNWWFRIGDFRDVKKRGDLVATRMGKLLRALSISIALLYVLLSVLTISYFFPVWWQVVVATTLLALLYPFSVILGTIFPVYAFRHFVHLPLQQSLARKASKVFRSHRAKKIAIAGSYGKTSMKELLAVVLAENKKIAYTRGNRNTLRSIAEFALSLDGDEDVLVIELGEAESGDIARMAQMIGPDFAVITGLAPNHLDGYADIDDIAHDFTSLVMQTGKDQSYINSDNALLAERLGAMTSSYSAKECLGYSITNRKLEVNKSSFTIRIDSRELKIESGLIGQHNIAALGFVAVFALKLEVSGTYIQKVLAETKPYEHRMEPRNIHGAW